MSEAEGGKWGPVGQRVEEPESFNVEFCLDCSYKHLTAIQDHLEDGVALSKSPEEREFLAGILQQIRDARKKVLDKLRETPKSEEAGECPTCKKKGNPEMEKLPSGFEKQQIKPAKYFDPSSFRTLCPQCPDSLCSKCPPELQETATRVIIGCKKGQFKEGKCQIGTEAHVIFHEPKG